MAQKKNNTPNKKTVNKVIKTSKKMAKSNPKGFIIAVIILFILVGLGVGGYFGYKSFFEGRKGNDPDSSQNSTQRTSRSRYEGDSGAIDINFLELGNKYHYYLELLDFAILDTSFIRDELDKKRIDRFVSNPLFKKIKNANVMHEYPFFDEEENVHGVIDLLVEYSDHIDIIDFKLSHVDDAMYEKQVRTYKNYISKLTSKKINTYVTGILSGDIKKVD